MNRVQIIKSIMEEYFTGAPEHIWFSQEKELENLTEKELLLLQKIRTTSDEKEYISIPEIVFKANERLTKRIEIVNSINKAKKSGAYEAEEHRTSELPLWDKE